MNNCGKGFKIIKDDDKLIVIHVNYRKHKTPIDIALVTHKIWILDNGSLRGINIPDDVIDNIRKVDSSNLDEVVHYCGDGFKIVKKNSKLMVINPKYKKYESDIDTVLATNRIWNVRPSVIDKSITRAFSVGVPKKVIENIKSNQK